MIQDVVLEIEKMKPVINDKGFLTFVEKIEQMKLDLEAQNLLDELANHSNISKFESKLPMNISIDWSKEIIDENLNHRKSSCHI